LERALKYKGYMVNSAEGKGSPPRNGRLLMAAHFPVPARDPVSNTVFRSFLEHIGLTKSDYIKQIRPKL